MDIYVGNISRSTTEETLRNEFSKHGAVDKVTIVMDKITGQPRGFAFVVMKDDNEANDAIAAMNNVELDGRTLRVNQAQPREERSYSNAGPRRPFNREGGSREGGFNRGGTGSGFSRGGGSSDRGGYRGSNDRGGFDRGGRSF